MAPKKVRICPGCPSKDLELDITPQFTFINTKQDNKRVTIIDTMKSKIKGKIASLF